MKLHRFIGNFNLNKDEIAIINPENIKQIKGVLRLAIGDHLILCDGMGTEKEVEILEINRDLINTKFIKKFENKEPNRKVSLYLAVLKKENFELAVQKAVECGVFEIIPVITERTIKTGLNMERLNKIILEASEQSGRTTLPKLYEIMHFEDAIKDGVKNEIKKFYDLVENSDENKGGKSGGNSSALLCGRPASATFVKNVSIFIGPEGGFSKDENTQAQKHGYIIASLGTLTLRGETAAMVATHLAVNNF
ncbi:MAG: 16S rRNA (uracil(1498)-N(3))-methyltransferase [bacterium]|nr:16S rRNA (uracil(1498)-N(3))-methyltransferase [bacterium]